MVTKNIEIFNTNQPLKFSTDRPVFKYDLYYKDEDEDRLSDFYKRERLDLSTYQPIEFFSELPSRKFEKWNFLRAWGYIDMIASKKAAEVFMRMCPDDVQLLPMIIKNKDDKYGQFENHDYYIVHILNLVPVFPEDKVVIDRTSFESYPYVDDVSCLDGHMIVRDKRFTGSIFFHPDLAREFAKFKGITFMTEEDIAAIKCFKKPEDAAAAPAAMV